MTTYEKGKEPLGAPMTWTYVTHEGCEIVLDSGHILRDLHADDADALCRDAHRAKLAEEAEGLVAEVCGSKYGEAQDWLRRYRETQQCTA